MKMKRLIFTILICAAVSSQGFAKNNNFIFAQSGHEQQRQINSEQKPKTLLELFGRVLNIKPQRNNQKIATSATAAQKRTTSDDSELPLITERALAASQLDVKIHVHNICMPKQCFRLDVFLNGEHVARWMTSPGKKFADPEFPGTYTPEFNEAKLITLNGPGYISHRGDPMPYAMHIDGSSAGVGNGFAIHGSNLTVNGEQASHGCMRLRTHHAKVLNTWVKKSIQTNGLRVVTVEDTMYDYSKKVIISPLAEQAIQQGMGGLF